MKRKSPHKVVRYRVTARTRMGRLRERSVWVTHVLGRGRSPGQLIQYKLRGVTAALGVLSRIQVLIGTLYATFDLTHPPALSIKFHMYHC